MADLPEQGIFQQSHARPVSGEHLEVLGKKAAAIWTSGEVSTLNEAVVETIKHAGLAPEQVKRVIEFANTDAYLTEFKKEGSHHVVNFSGGPADPAVILRDLNDGGGGSVFDRGTADYHQPPRTSKTASASLEKTASVREAEPDLVDEFFQKIASDDVGYPEVNPYGDVIELRDKLASYLDNITSSISGLETAYSDLADRVYSGVKQAALSGTTLGQIIQVWNAAVPSTEHVKIAFSLFTPRLLKEGVFTNGEKLAQSIEKVGSAHIVNNRHPMFTDYQEYCDVLSKLAEARQLQGEVAHGVAELETFLKQAGWLSKTLGMEAKKTGLVDKIVGGAAKASKPVGSGAKSVAEKLLGSGEAADMVGTVAEKATKYAPHAAGVLAANEVRRHLKYSPTWNKVQSVANPLSDQYKMREMQIAQNGGGGYYQ